MSLPTVPCECSGVIFAVPCGRCHGTGRRPATLADMPAIAALTRRVAALEQEIRGIKEQMRIGS